MSRRKLLSGLLIIGAFVTAAARYGAAPSFRVRQDVTDQSGAITGRVVNTEGQPIAGAEVIAPRDGQAMGKLPMTLTDEQGRFTLSSLRPGLYTLFASKASDGYPDTMSRFYSKFPVPPVRTDVYNGGTSEVEIQIAKAAKLTGRVADADTNKPILNAVITIRRTDDPNNFTSAITATKGRFVILVPPLPLTITVKAPGYEDWTYSLDGTGSHADILELKQEETKELTIIMRQRAKAA